MELSRQIIEDGRNSKFWKAVEEMLSEWIADIYIQLEDQDGGNDLGMYKKLTGNLQSLRRVAAMPEFLKLRLEEQYDERNDKGE